MLGKAYDSTVDWLILQSQSNEGLTIHAHASFLLSNWECIFGQCPGLINEDDTTFQADIGCCGEGFYVSDAADLTHVEAMVTRLSPDDWDEANRAFVIKRGYKAGATTDDEALQLGWKQWKKRPRKGQDPHNPDHDDWELKSRVREGACVFANRSTGTVGSQGRNGCAFLHLGQREQNEAMARGKDEPMLEEVVELSSSDTDARHDISMPQVCHQVPLRFEYEHDDDGKLTSVTIQPWDADQWTGGDGEYEGSWWCVDDKRAYVAKTPLHERMRGTIERVIGAKDYEHLAAELTRRQSTVAPMPVTADLADGRELIPLAVAGKTLVRPAPLFTDTWEGKLDIAMK